jgi:nucleoside-diphosphate-sugar epimerase
MTILITGICGFAGGAVALELVRRLEGVTLRCWGWTT